jgi:hypothetical protein
MGVNLSGTITGSNLEKDECCDPQEACFLIRKFENVPNGQPYYEWYTNDWVSYDKPLSGWYFNMSNGTNSYGPFGPSDILGEVLVCNLPVGLQVLFIPLPKLFNLDGRLPGLIASLKPLLTIMCK